MRPTNGCSRQWVINQQAYQEKLGKPQSNFPPKLHCFFIFNLYSEFVHCLIKTAWYSQNIYCHLLFSLWYQFLWFWTTLYKFAITFDDFQIFCLLVKIIWTSMLFFWVGNSPRHLQEKIIMERRKNWRALIKSNRFCYVYHSISY